ncbi:MAG TPA: PQQ-binding-like beta-propeller repeat protein [Gaiellaceae bacterium]|nr:PQQ-binding-like beta-propeller repeat protein [Gaiellaceae bacterium]
MRRGVTLIALGLLLAGCGGGRQAAPPTTTAPTHPVKHHHKACRAPITQLVVTVLDGDLRKRVPGALVRILHKRKRTDRHGVAAIDGPRSRLLVEVSKPGYTTVRLPVDFRRRKQTIRIYQPKLQWPIYGATPARTDAPAAIKLRPPFRVIWSRGMGELIEFPAVVWDGRAYLGNLHGTIHAIDMRSGAITWTHDTPGSPRMASSPAVWDDEVVYHTMSGGVYVLDRTNGRQLWSWNAGAPIEPSPIVRDGVDYFGTSGGTVYALDLRTHKVLWSRPLGAKITSSAAFADGKLFVGDYAGRLWALSPRTGAAHLLGTVNGKIYGTPAVSAGRVFVPSSDGDSLTAFTTSGRYLWRITTGNYVYSSPAVWDGRVFFGSYTGTFYGVSAATGHVFWRVYAGGAISGAAVVVDGIAYAGSTSHRIVGVDARTGREVLNFPHGEFVPVSGNGMRLLLNGFSRLYAVEPRHKRPRVHRVSRPSKKHARKQTSPC